MKSLPQILAPMTLLFFMTSCSQDTYPEFSEVPDTAYPLTIKTEAEQSDGATPSRKTVSLADKQWYPLKKIPIQGGYFLIAQSPQDQKVYGFCKEKPVICLAFDEGTLFSITQLQKDGTFLTEKSSFDPETGEESTDAVSGKLTELCK